MLNRASRDAPHSKNKNVMKYVPRCNCTRMAGSTIDQSTNCTPHANASTPGAMPKLITSASESNSRPKSDTVFVIRAMRPSNPSTKTEMPM